MADKTLDRIALTAPIEGADKTRIAEIELRRPSVGALRGLQLAQVQLQDVGTLITLIPRISQPVLTEDQVAALDPADFAAIANRVSRFFMSRDQLAAVQGTA